MNTNNTLNHNPKVLKVFFKQVSGHKFMFLDKDKNLCKMSNSNEINFYRVLCPENLRPFVPEYKSDFYMIHGLDHIDFDE